MRRGPNDVAVVERLAARLTSVWSPLERSRIPQRGRRTLRAHSPRQYKYEIWMPLFRSENEGGIRYERVELAASVRLSPLAVRVERTRFDAVSLGIVEPYRNAYSRVVKKNLTRTEVQDDR